MLKKTLVGVAIALIATEGALRTLGFSDFPLYDADASIGYIPKANQSGAFMNKNDWVFNEEHMGSGPFRPGPGRDILLIGDSLVFGGNKYRQDQKLGASLQRALPQGTAVWPIGAGSWSLNNELTWLKKHAHVVSQVEDIVFVLNSEDLLDSASSWRCESTHPRSKPWSILWYQVQKHLSPERCEEIPPELHVPATPWRQGLMEWLKSPEVINKRIHFVLHPRKDELGTEPSNIDAMKKKLRGAGLDDVLDIGEAPGWHRDFYADIIHPTPEGNAILGKFIANHLQSHSSNAP